jgi:hypothetical protein
MAWRAVSAKLKISFLSQANRSRDGPVALDHLLIDMIEEKRRQEGAPSIFDRSRKHLPSVPKLDPNFNFSSVNLVT